MALTADQLSQIRQLIDEEDSSEGWSDTALNLVADNYVNSDGSYDIDGIVGKVWRAKAASYVEMVNTSESGSRRDLSDMFDHALAMAKLYGDSDGGSTDPDSYPRSTKIVRATREV